MDPVCNPPNILVSPTRLIIVADFVTTNLLIAINILILHGTLPRISDDV